MLPLRPAAPVLFAALLASGCDPGTPLSELPSSRLWASFMGSMRDFAQPGMPPGAPSAVQGELGWMEPSGDCLPVEPIEVEVLSQPIEVTDAGWGFDPFSFRYQCPTSLPFFGELDASSVSEDDDVEVLVRGTASGAVARMVVRGAFASVRVEREGEGAVAPGDEVVLLWFPADDVLPDDLFVLVRDDMRQIFEEVPADVDGNRIAFRVPAGLGAGSYLVEIVPRTRFPSAPIVACEGVETCLADRLATPVSPVPLEVR